MTVKRTLGYVRTSRGNGKSQSVENQKRDLLAYDPEMKIYVDNDVSGENNLDNPNTQWARLWQDFMSNPQDTQICVVAYDRLGRAKGALLHTLEKIIRNGGTLHVVWENKTYDNLDDSEQNLETFMESYVSEQYRKEVKIKTQRALDELKQQGVRLGARPKLGDQEVAQIKKLWGMGLGYKSISKFVDASPRTIKKVIKGDYKTRDEWEKQNQQARKKMKKKKPH